MISTGQYLATEAGAAILQAGGNAVDAGVAAGIAMGVVHSDQVQFAGVAPMLIYLAEQDRIVTVSGLGGWPRAASLDLFEQKYGAQIPVGILRTVVPAAPDAWIRTLDRYGTMSFEDVAAAAIRYAREGFSMHAFMQSFITKHEKSYRNYPENAAIYLPNGRVPAVGERFVQSDLANTLQYMVDEERAARSRGRSAGLSAARDAFYVGDIGRRIVRYHEENGGLLTADDLAGFSSEFEDPISVKFGDIEVYGCNAWCQGPTFLQMVKMLEGVNLKVLGHNSTGYIHLLAEVMNLCFSDREYLLGDPRFQSVPVEQMLSKAYLEQRRTLIDPDKAFGKLAPRTHLAAEQGTFGERPASSGAADHFPGDTSHVCVVDAKGNVCSITPSDVTWESPIIPGLGICPSARGTQSWAVRGHPSALAPGKRPRLTPSPHLCRRSDGLLMPIGSPGGDTQPQGNLQVFLNYFIFGMGIQEAIEAPRFVTRSFPDSFSPHPYYPGRLEIEEPIGRGVGSELAQMGHGVEWLPPLSVGTAGVHAIVAEKSSGILRGGADPRRTGRAMGW